MLLLFWVSKICYPDFMTPAWIVIWDWLQRVMWKVMFDGTEDWGILFQTKPSGRQTDDKSQLGFQWLFGNCWSHRMVSRFELTSSGAGGYRRCWTSPFNNQRTNYPGLPWSFQTSILHRTSNRMWDPLWFGIVNSGNIIETTLVILEADRSSTLFLYAKSQLHLVPTHII